MAEGNPNSGRQRSSYRKADLALIRALMGNARHIAPPMANLIGFVGIAPLRHYTPKGICSDVEASRRSNEVWISVPPEIIKPE